VTDTLGRVRAELAAGLEVKREFLRREARTLARIADLVADRLRAGRRVYLAGNGGSAADAQHIAAELEGRYRRDRPALPVMSLTTNTSTLTAVANDFGYARSFARPVEAHVRKGDVVILISTSGRSPNVLAAARAARKAGATVVGFTGDSGGALRRLAHLCLRVPSDRTSSIQECHIAAGHAVCEVVEGRLFGK